MDDITKWLAGIDLRLAALEYVVLKEPTDNDVALKKYLDAISVKREQMASLVYTDTSQVKYYEGYVDALHWLQNVIKEERKPMLEDLKKAAEEGRVRTFTSDAPEDILYNDCDNTITLIRDIGIEGGFGISVADGGGFTGVLFAPEQWREMNAKVEAFMKEKGWT